MLRHVYLCPTGRCVSNQSLTSFLEVFISQLTRKIYLMRSVCPILGIWRMPGQAKHKVKRVDKSCDNPQVQCRVCMWHGYVAFLISYILCQYVGLGFEY